MAAAEARAAWQRTANRCFVQEDAKRAPKLACVPPSSSSLSKQADTRPASNGLDEFIPPSPSANSIYSNLSPDSRWWLQLQPNYMHQKGLTNEQVNSHQFVDIMDCQSTVKGYNLGEESYEFVEMDCSSTGFKQVDEFNLDSEFPHWMESEKSHELPWWRMTDKGDLASFVAQRSHDFMENCDLPQPQNRNFNNNQRSFSYKKEYKPQKHQTIHASLNSNSGPVSPLSTESGDSRATVDEGSGDMDESKRKLLEALCHSQTRAREAEKAAKKAHEEKEHVVKLIFKQASQLFAYKQWLYLLQLENLYNQIKSNKIPPIFPASPWQVPRKKARRNWPPAGKRKTGAKPGCKHQHDDDCIGNYGVAFAVGLGLVGAGLLLGWTVAWMFI